jgi:hypothetical protein
MLHNAGNYRVSRFRGGIACCDSIPGGGAGFDDTTAETRALIASAMPNGYVYVTKILDVHGAGSDGRKEARFTVALRNARNERRSFQSSGWQSYVDNPDTTVVADYRSQDSITARGWYERFGYTNATYGDMYCSAAPPTVSGVWQPKVKMGPGPGAGAGDVPPRSHRPGLPCGLGRLDRQAGGGRLRRPAVDRHDSARQRAAQARPGCEREKDLAGRSGRQRNQLGRPGNSVRRRELRLTANRRDRASPRWAVAQRRRWASRPVQEGRVALTGPTSTELGSRQPAEASLAGAKLSGSVTLTLSNSRQGP